MQTLSPAATNLEKTTGITNKKTLPLLFIKRVMN